MTTRSAGAERVTSKTVPAAAVALLALVFATESFWLTCSRRATGAARCFGTPFTRRCHGCAVENEVRRSWVDAVAVKPNVGRAAAAMLVFQSAGFDHIGVAGVSDTMLAFQIDEMFLP